METRGKRLGLEDGKQKLRGKSAQNSVNNVPCGFRRIRWPCNSLFIISIPVHLTSITTFSY
jgi:hypothetical protein